MLSEEGCELVKGDIIQPVVQIHMPSARNNVEFLRFGRQLVGVFAELSGMSILTRDEKHGTRRNRLYVCKRVKIHEFNVAAKRRMRCEFWRLAFRSIFSPWSAVEIIKLTLNGGRVFIQFMHRPTGVFGFTTRELYIALLGRRFDDFLSLLERLRVPEPVTVGSAHVVHADCRDGFYARVDLGCADDKAPAATNPDSTNPIPVNKRPGAQEIHRSTEILGIDIR